MKMCKQMRQYQQQQKQQQQHNDTIKLQSICKQQQRLLPPEPLPVMLPTYKLDKRRKCEVNATTTPTTITTLTVEKIKSRNHDWLLLRRSCDCWYKPTPPPPLPLLSHQRDTSVTPSASPSIIATPTKISKTTTTTTTTIRTKASCSNKLLLIIALVLITLMDCTTISRGTGAAMAAPLASAVTSSRGNVLLHNKPLTALMSQAQDDATSSLLLPTIVDSNKKAQQQRQLQQQQLFVLLNSNRKFAQQQDSRDDLTIPPTAPILLKNLQTKPLNRSNSKAEQRQSGQTLKPLIMETAEFASDDGDHYDKAEKDLMSHQNNYSSSSQEHNPIYVSNDDCPKECKCLNDYFDCGRKHLDRVPQLPNYVQVIDFVGNRFNDTNVLAIKNLPKLNKLILKRNQLAVMPQFEGLSSLKHLSLANNLIQRIASEALTALPKLKSLDLSKNYLHTIEANYFPKNVPLAQLILNNNEISTIEENAFENLPDLLDLELNFNHLNTLPAGVFGNLGKLKKLSLNYNNLEINWSTFRGLHALQKLFLKANNIRTLQDGVFHVMRAIETIELDHNGITSLSRQGLFNLTKLHHLSLSNNSITRIELDTWEFTQSLITLDLSHNNISDFKPQHLDCLQRLKHLNLGHNKIQYLMENTFECVKNLEDLNLRRNKLSWNIEDPSATPAFKSLRKLKKLDLYGNNLKQINTKSLSGLSSLEHLNLGNNALASVQAGAFDHMPQLQKLILKSLNFICDCDILWFKLWLNRHFESATKKQLHTASSQVVCGYPEHLLDHELMSLNQNELTCADTPKPVLTLEPTNTLAVKGANITLECVATSPTAASLAAADELKIKWRHDNQNVKERERIVSYNTLAAAATTYITTETQIYHDSNNNMTSIKGYLRLFNVTYDTAGKYQCVVSNAFGTTYSEKFKISIGIRPSFLQIPSNLTIDSGDTARLVCSATGDPMPEIALQKFGASNFPAATERRLQVIREENAFIITKAKPSDSGIYTCTAESAAGDIKINASLLVNDKPLPDIPVIYKETILGRSTVLECFNDMAAELIKPHREWYKDNKPVHITATAEVERYYFTAGKELFIIVNTQSIDAGRYRCEITDNIKTYAMYMDLVVVREDFNQNVILVGIVLVTISCILIGSLFVWIILFHQKKRMYSNNMGSIRASTGSGARVAAVNNRGSTLDQTQLTTLNRTYLRSPGTEYAAANQRPRSLAALELNGIRYKEEVDSLRETINGGQRSCLIVTPTPNYPQFLRQQQRCGSSNGSSRHNGATTPEERNGLLDEEHLTLEYLRRNAAHDLDHQHDHLSSKDSGTGSDAAVKRSLEDFSLALIPTASTPAAHNGLIRRHIGRASLAKPDPDDDDDDEELNGEKEEEDNDDDEDERATLTTTPQQEYTDSFIPTPTIGLSTPSEIELHIMAHNNNHELLPPEQRSCSIFSLTSYSNDGVEEDIPALKTKNVLTDTPAPTKMNCKISANKSFCNNSSTVVDT